MAARDGELTTPQNGCVTLTWWMSFQRTAMIRNPPPPVISCARVLEYAFLDDTVQYTGRQKLYVGQELLGAVPCLAICKNLASPEQDVLILYCDEEWNSLGASGAASIEEAKNHLENAYAGIENKWVRSEHGDKDVRQFLEMEWGELRCRSCGKWPFEVDTVIQEEAGCICGECAKAQR